MTSEQYRAEFGEAIESLKVLIDDIFRSEKPDLQPLEDFSDAVFIKNDSGTLVFANTLLRKLTASGDDPVGRQARGVLRPMLAALSHYSDSIIFSGCDTIECEYVHLDADGKMCRVRTYKCDLRPYRKAGYSVLGMSRRLYAIEGEQKNRFTDNESACAVYYRFDPKDREICRLTALGRSSKEIGLQLEMTGRNVDIRRKKALEELGVEKPIDLARLLVRLQERGYLDLGL